MIAKVVIGSGMYSFKLLEAEREVELYVGGGIGIVSQLLMVMEAVIFSSHAQVHVPLHARLFPLFEPFHLGSWAAEEFHFHLLEFPHPEYELAGDDFIPECLANLRDSERNLHAARLLNVEIFNEYSLCCLRTQVDFVIRIASVADLSGEHQVELAHVSPVLGSGNRIHDVAVQDDLLILFQIVGLLCSHITIMYFFVFCLFAEVIRIRSLELLLVESIPEALAALLHLFVHLFLYLSEIVLDKVVCAVPFLGVLIVYQRVVERSHVPRRHPSLRMHEYAGVYSHYIFIQPGHGVPPILLDVILQFHAILAIVIDCCQTIINFAGWEYESVLLAMRNQHLEQFVLCHDNLK